MLLLPRRERQSQPTRFPRAVATGTPRVLIDRHQALATMLGSVRLEDAEPSPEMLALAERWAEGKLSTAELRDAAGQAAAGGAADTDGPHGA